MGRGQAPKDPWFRKTTSSLNRKCSRRPRAIKSFVFSCKGGRQSNDRAWLLQTEEPWWNNQFFWFRKPLAYGDNAYRRHSLWEDFLGWGLLLRAVLGWLRVHVLFQDQEWESQQAKTEYKDAADLRRSCCCLS